jgi:hypothetical protein
VERTHRNPKRSLALTVVVSLLILLPHLSSTVHAAAGERMVDQGDGIVERYAVMINGGPESEFWDDVAFMYATLTDDYGFSPSRIYLLNHNGTNPSGVNPDGMIDYPATWANIDLVFNELSGLVDDDDFLLVWVTDHGNGYYGDPEDKYYGYLGSSASVDLGDEQDYLESEFKLRSFCTAGSYATPTCNHGMDVFKVYYTRTSSTLYRMYRNKFVSSFTDLTFEQDGVQSDNDVYIEKLVDYLLGDTDRDGNIELGQGEVFDYDGDGIPPYDPDTGVFDEDDWGDLDYYTDDVTGINTAVPGNSYIIFDYGLDNHVDIDINYDINNLEVDGTDIDNQGLFDGIDANDDGDMDDWVSIDEHIWLQGSSSVTDDQMATFLDRVDAGVVVVFMDQCYSGGFVDDLSAPGRIIVTGSGEEEPASTGIVGTSLISALHRARPDGSPVDADYNRDGHVSIREAFNYAGVQENAHTAQYDDNGDGVSHPYPVPYGGDGTLGATTYFEDADLYHLAVDSMSGGLVTSPGEGLFAYSYDAVVTLIATPDTGYAFGFWTGAVTDPESSTTTVTMDADKRVVAHFVPETAEVIYVDTDASGAGNGSSWADAYAVLQDGLDAAQPGDEIWVAEGTYTPTELVDPGDPRTASFQMQNGVAIYGGFEGVELGRDARDPVNNVTLLSGDIGVGGDNADNSYHVFYHPTGLGLDNAAVLDGFTIADGNADGGGVHADGGGMFNQDASPRIANCVFLDNAAADDGGGMYNGSSHPVVQTSIFDGNSAADAGGGMYNYYSAPYVTDCTFLQNTADDGGGMGNGMRSAPTLIGCTFTGNVGDTSGGGMFNSIANPMTVIDCIFSSNVASRGGGVFDNYTSSQFIDCVFDGNSASFGGGAYIVTSAPRFVNCVFSGNSASRGGGIYNYSATSLYLLNATLFDNSASYGDGLACYSSSTVSNIRVVNSILWNGGDEIWNNDGSIVAITYSDVQGGYAGTGNIDADPLFVDAANGDTRLSNGSPCIDVGDDAAVFAFGDFEGDGRPFDGDGNGAAIVDIGADEYDGPPTAVTLVSFEATPQEDGVLVTWETAIEIDSVGFNLYRSELPDGEYVRLNDALIPSQSPGAVSGAAYVWNDTQARADIVYYYKLEEVEVGGVRWYYGPIRSDGGAPTSVCVKALTAEAPPLSLAMAVALTMSLGGLTFVWYKRH